MAAKKQDPKTATLYNAKTGSKVTVAEDQADKLKQAGYTTTKPKDA